MSRLPKRLFYVGQWARYGVLSCITVLVRGCSENAASVRDFQRALREGPFRLEIVCVGTLYGVVQGG